MARRRTVSGRALAVAVGLFLALGTGIELPDICGVESAPRPHPLSAPALSAGAPDSIAPSRASAPRVAQASNASERPVNVLVCGWPTGYLPDAQVRARVDLAMLGRVESIGQSFWNTPDRTRPAGWDEDVTRNPAHRIYTPVQIAVQRSVLAPADSPSAGTFTLYRFGGQVGADKMDFCAGGEVSFRPGERVLVFLKKSASYPDPVAGWEIVDSYALLGDGTAQGRKARVGDFELFARTSLFLHTLVIP